MPEMAETPAVQRDAAHDDLVSWADQLDRHGVLEEAVRLLEVVLREEPARADVRLKLAETLLSLERLDDARNVLRPLLVERPDHPVARAIDAYARYLASGPGELPALREAAMLPGAPATAWLGLAIAERMAGDPQAVLSAIERAVDLDHDHPGVHLEYGRVLAQVGRLQEAVTSLYRGMGLAPGRPDIRYELGVALTRAGRMSEAAQVFAEGTKLFPDILEFARELLAASEHSEPRLRWSYGVVGGLFSAVGVSALLEALSLPDQRIALISAPLGLVAGAGIMAGQKARHRSREKLLPPEVVQARRAAAERIEGPGRRQFSLILNSIALICAAPLFLISLIAITAVSETADLAAALGLGAFTGGICWFSGRRLIRARRWRPPTPQADPGGSGPPQGCECETLLGIGGPHGRRYAAHLKPMLAGLGFTEYECPHTRQRWLGWIPNGGAADAFALVRLEREPAPSPDDRPWPGQYL